jgi:adenosine deaminase
MSINGGWAGEATGAMDSASRDFQEALAAEDLDGLRAVPKGDLHCHGILAGNRRDWKGWLGISVPVPPLPMDGLGGMHRYLGEAWRPLARTRAGMEFGLRAAFRQARADGVTVLEMSYDTVIFEFYPEGVDAAVALLRAIHQETAPEIDFRPELGLNQAGDMEQMKTDFDAAAATGYFRAVDLYGPEGLRELREFTPFYRRAAALGWKRKAHAGEFGTAESVRRAVEILELDAVQHGIGAADSPEVMRWLRDCGTQLNVCPSSNVGLGRVPRLREHPVRRLFDAGVRVTVNSDDIFLFDRTVSQEFLALYREGVFSAAELDAIRLAALGE